MKENRATDKSTREIDNAVQELFMTGECIIIDHHGTIQANENTFRRLLGRLEFEHPHIISKLTIDKNNFRIRIKNFKYED